MMNEQENAMRNDQKQEKGNRKKRLLIPLAVFLLASSVCGAAIYSGMKIEMQKDLASNENHLDDDKLSHTAKSETEEQKKDIAATSVPLVTPSIEDGTDSAPGGVRHRQGIRHQLEMGMQMN